MNLGLRKKYLLIFLLFISNTVKAQCIDSIESAFDELGRKGQKVRIKTSKKEFPSKHEYRITIKNKFGKGNHFQGATIIPNTNSKYFVISGADKNVKKSWLYFGKFTYLKRKIQAELIDRYEIKFNHDQWHVGGLGIDRNVLAVPMETLGLESNSSTIHFYQINIDERNEKILLKPFSQKIISKGFGAGAVDIILKETRNQILVDVGIFTGGKFKFLENINLHRNTINDLTGRVYETDAFKGANVDFVKDCKGSYYLISSHNESFLQVFNTKKNALTLYEFNQKSDNQESAVKKVKTRKLQCGVNCNFRAAAGVVAEENKLKVFSVKFYRSRWNQLIKGRLFQN